jgi:undecaprenyl-diphosphatase
MDAAAYRWFNRLADHTGWAHTFFIDYAKYGVGLFAVLLLVGWWYAARHDEGASRTVGVMWAGAAAVVADPVAHRLAQGPLRPLLSR